MLSDNILDNKKIKAFSILRQRKRSGRKKDEKVFSSSSSEEEEDMTEEEKTQVAGHDSQLPDYNEVLMI